MTDTDPAARPAEFLKTLFDFALAVADPMRMIAGHLPERPTGRVVVVCAGKGLRRAWPRGGGSQLGPLHGAAD